MATNFEDFGEIKTLAQFAQSVNDHTTGAVTAGAQIVNNHTSQTAQSINDHTTGAATAGARIVNDHTDQAAADLQRALEGHTTQTTAEAVRQVNAHTSGLFSRFGEKEPWFYIVAILVAVAAGAVMYHFTPDLATKMAMDANNNPTQVASSARNIVAIMTGVTAFFGQLALPIGNKSI